MTDKKEPDWIWLAIGGIITLGLTLLGMKNQSQPQTTSTSTPTPAPSHHPSPITSPTSYHHDVSNISYGSSYNTRNGNKGGCGCGL